MAIHEFPLHHDVLGLIRSGKKDLIVAIVPENLEETQIAIGDVLMFAKDLRKVVGAIRWYASFDIMLEHEDQNRIRPDTTKIQMMQRLLEQFSATEEERGILVYEIVPHLRLVSTDLVKKKKKTTFR
ncbi:MAG: hypothetical protein Q8R25_02625 [bacterium]|nr:hypothetical protein [bacterium]